jgi:Zn-dependent protease with chaperone function
MDLTKFRGLVERLEREAAGDPQGYRTRVIALAVLGYGYVVGMLAGTVATIVWLIRLAQSGYDNALVIKLILAAGLFCLLILRALWVRFPPPTGLELSRSDTPKLFPIIEEIRQALDGPRVHHVLLTTDLNAAVVQIPQLGVLGWQRNYLLLGLPLMQALGPDQFRSVLAHEFGHLSGNHGRMQGWIYRVRQTWAQLLSVLQGQRRRLTGFLFTPFVEWYAPFFNAYSFVLARQDEFVADRCAADVAGPDVAASALQRIEVVGRFTHEKFWADIGRAAQEKEEPPGPMAAFLPTVRQTLGRDVAERWLGEARSRPTDFADTHPSLSDRLAALGCSLTICSALVPQEGEASAAQEYIGQALEGLAAKLDDQWRASVAAAWRAEYEATKTRRGRLAELEAQAARGEVLDTGARFEQVQLTASLGSTEIALGLAKSLASAEPGHAATRYFIGITLLEQGEEAGIAHLEAAMQLEPGAILPASGVLFQYLWNKGRRDEAERYRTQAIERSKALEGADAERKDLRGPVRFESHQLTADTVAAIRRALYQLEGLAEVYLVRRQVQKLPEMPCYLVGILLKRGTMRYQSQTADAAIYRRVFEGVQWPQGTYGILLNGARRNLRQRFRRVPGAELLSATASPPDLLAGTDQTAHGRQEATVRKLRAAARSRRWRRGFGIAALGTVALVIVAMLRPAPEPPRDPRAGQIAVEDISVDQAANRILAAAGRPRMVLLYDAYRDPRDQLVPLLQYGIAEENRGLVVQAYAIDRDRADVQDFLLESGLGIPGVRLQEWPRGELIAAMVRVNIGISGYVATPTIAVLDTAGTLTAEWEGGAPLRMVKHAVEAALMDSIQP